jgi:hypothetical protein
MNKLTKQKLVAFALLLLVCSYAIAQDKVASWDFPIKPGTEKWNQLETETGRLNVLQIPDNILKVIETEELVVTCLNYPSAFHYTAYDNEQVGLQKVISNFNGLQELFIRKDAGRYLIEHYKNAYAQGFRSKDNRISERYWPWRFLYLELLLSRRELIQNLEAGDKLKLLQTTLNKLDLKIQNKEVFSKYDNINSALIVVRILEVNNVDAIVSNSVYMNFASNREFPDYKTLEEIIELGKTHIGIH